MGEFLLEMIKTTLAVVVLLLISDSLYARRGRGGGGGRGRGGSRQCADGSTPVCSDLSTPVFDGDRTTPPCPDGGRPATCADGSIPARVRGGGRGGRSRCLRSEEICCDGSTPVFDGDFSTPPCSDGTRPRCSLAECSNNPEIEIVPLGPETRN